MPNSTLPRTKRYCTLLANRQVHLNHMRKANHVLHWASINFLQITKNKRRGMRQLCKREGMYLAISRLIELTFLGFKSFSKRLQILPCSQIDDETLTTLRFHPVRFRGNNLCVKCALSFGFKAHYTFFQRCMDEIIPIRFNHLQQSTKNNLNIDEIEFIQN